MTAADIDARAVRELAERMRENAEQLDLLNQRISRFMDSLDWRDDIWDFHQFWNTELTHQLKDTAQALRSADLQLTHKADSHKESSTQAGSSFQEDSKTQSITSGSAGLAKPFATNSQEGLPRQGIKWFGYTASSAIDWTSQRIQDGADLGRQVFDLFSRVSPSAAGAVRAGQSIANATGKLILEPLLTRRAPQASEVFAHGALILGTTVGFALNFATGMDFHFFDDGKPYIGSPKVVQRRGDGPTDFADLTRITMSAYADEGDPPAVTITVIRNIGQEPRYIVSIPGTEADIRAFEGWSGSAQANDWPANFYAMANGTNSFTQATMAAVDKVIALDHSDSQSSPNRPIMLLTGHSQGGLTSANLAADSGFTARYAVVAVVSYAGPVEAAEIPTHIPVLSLENSNDPVPRSDLGGVGLPLSSLQKITLSAANITQIGLPAVGTLKRIGDNHAASAYQQNVENLSPLAKHQINYWSEKNNLGQFYIADDGYSTTIKVPVGRTG